MPLSVNTAGIQLFHKPDIVKTVKLRQSVDYQFVITYFYFCAAPAFLLCPISNLAFIFTHYELVIFLPLAVLFYI